MQIKYLRGISNGNLLASLVNHPACNESSLVSAVVFNLPPIILPACDQDVQSSFLQCVGDQEITDMYVSDTQVLCYLHILNNLLCFQPFSSSYYNW